MTRIIIVGCGIVGAAIAYELSLIPSLEITVIEQKTPASGSTGAALGVLMGVISGKKKGRAWKYRDYSLRRYETLIPELEAKTGVKIPVNRQGIVKLLFEGDNLEKWRQLQQNRQNNNWQLEIWDREYLTNQCPQILDERIVAAVYSPQDRQINPQILTKALVEAATDNGVEFKFGVSVNKILSSAQEEYSQRIMTSQGNLESDWLILAAGLGSTPLTDSVSQKLDLRPVVGQAMKLKVNQDLGLAEFQPVITGNDIHLVPLGNQEYWLGATVEFPDELGNAIAEPELLEKMKADAIAFCPELKNATILETWSGKRPRPQGQPAPVIGKLANYQNVLLATGHYRNGVLLAPATAKEVIDLIS
ncbi:glycine/D-amino acid oxidase, deaminating [Xenococcus sp. PCC 7305]|uniref:NAD(P)/FAD-dependent oxidoreductase n=1 Tax=Xenococcus sp. PCC 7305 TaxID=102125 RepID=UPI0002ABD2AC|nr:FAD-dependent oxidoreductase [Xenococcus sp. PCC 7305]ELS01571.1 glycine/D-amino acid oxidase, deaminating [Xenococcus sp. PCC 7305]